MKITVIGCGRWGTFIAWYLDRKGHVVTLYGRKDSSRMKLLAETRSNGMLSIAQSIRLSSDLFVAEDSDVIVISIGAQGLRALMEEFSKLSLKNKIFVLCMKGIEVGSGKRLTEVMKEFVDVSCKTAVWIGPGHPQEFCRGIPNCMVIDSEDDETKTLLVSEFSSDLIRFYYGQDLIGNEIGAAAKNVIGIAAGMLDGCGLTSLKGALMSRGTREISKLIQAMGGNELSAYGLCHLGDYEATLFSPYSHNRMFGEQFVKQQPFDKLAEGYYTVKAICELAAKYRVELPICETVYRVLYCGEDYKTALSILFTRDLKGEIK